MALITKFLEMGGKLLGGSIKTAAGLPKGIWNTVSSAAKEGKTTFSATSSAREAAKATSDSIKAAASQGKIAAMQKATNFETSFSGTPIGKAFHASRTAAGLGARALFRNPIAKMMVNAPASVQYTTIVAAGVVGIAYGGVKSAINRSNERTQANAQRGMASNNLGTDGLTLALSKRRHR